MNVIDPGHVYELDFLDEEPGLPAEYLEGSGVKLLTFVKREGPGYPGNVGRHAGTNIQEVLRALINRVQYLDSQIPHPNNWIIIQLFRESILQLENRAAERHGRPPLERFIQEIEKMPTCIKCGYIGCKGECHS